ncbi:MAG: ComEC/Rec2 family competence protein [Mycoplasmataceae bacterium]|nr:ComEC/Rec2 family competence protein [Mycoplasmataceae bacterium]
MTKFIKKSYDNNTSIIILLICFSTKINNESWDIYNQTKHLSIVYLLSVGGLQVSFLKLFIQKIIRNKKASNIMNLILISFYCYLLSFASGILRVLLCLIISISFRKWVKNKYDILALSGMVTMFIEPSCVFNYGFCLSYLCTYFVIWIYEFNLPHVLFELLLINVGCIIISIPFVSKMEGIVSLSAIIFAIGFNYIFMGLYLWYILTFYMIFLKTIHEFLANNLIFIIYSIYAINVEIKINKFNNLIVSCFYLFIHFLLSLIDKKVKINMKF